MKFKINILCLLIAIGFSNCYALEGRPKLRRACLNRLDSTLDLLWFKPSDNCNSFTNFSLYGRDNSLSVYQYIATYNSLIINTLSLKLPNLKDWEFYLVYNKSCDGLDSLYSDTIKIDNSPPLNSDLDSVSIDLATQKTLIGWSNNSSPDVKGYLVYHVTGQNSVITNTNGTSYLDNGARDPTVGPINYSVAAYDSCNNASLISPPHSTIYLQNTYNQCTKSINLNWSNYIGWPVDMYQIYRKINAGNYQLVGTVVSNINQFTYNFNTFGDSYCFFIRAVKVGGGISSSSNFNCVNTSGIISSKNSYIAKASVQDGNIELVLITELGTSLEKINIYKAEENNSFSIWQTINSTGGNINLIDNNVKVHTRSYKYYFTTEGPCSLIFDTSQVAKTILLNAFLIAPGNQEITWSLYDDFIKSTQSQELLLSDNPNFNKSSPWNILQNLGPNTIRSADFTSFSINQERICYCIRAIENPPIQAYPRQDTSYSNIECLTADPIVYFPNAIQINGYNTSFYPQGVFLDYEKSTFQIYNRWGEIIYETNDIRKAWNGDFNGQFVLPDVYVYRSTIFGINGKVFVFDGTITVLK